MSVNDLLIVNANIITLDQHNSLAKSMLISNGKIVNLWTTIEPPKSEIKVNRKVDIVNLNGATVLPGFQETHNHILTYAKLKKQVDCSFPKNKRIIDIQQNLRERSVTTPVGKWIMGHSYDETLLEEKRHPNRLELDSVSAEHPIFLKHVSGHFAVVNSVALELSNITEFSSDPQGGHFGRGNDGRLNGVLYEEAVRLVQSKIPFASVDEQIQLLGQAAEEYISLGITASTDTGVGMGGRDDLVVHLEALKKGTNPLHMRLMIMNDLLKGDGLFANHSASEVKEYISTNSNGKGTLDAAKIFQDGSIQGMTAALRKPYFNDKSKTGELVNQQSEFEKEVFDLHKRGFRIAVHGNGDRAIESIINAYESALNKEAREDHRHRIEHLQTATMEDLVRIKNLGIAGSFFINHVYYYGDRHKRIYLGPERAERINPLSDASDLDILYTLHSDCPVTPVSPLFSIWAAVNRKTREGDILGKEQRVDVETAIRGMTSYGAAISFDENNSGMIKKGYKADLVILEENPFVINKDSIKDINVLSTIINGEVVFGHNHI